MNTCHRCKTEYEFSSVKKYPWGRDYCCVECFLNIKKPEPEPKKEDYGYFGGIPDSNLPDDFIQLLKPQFNIGDNVKIIKGRNFGAIGIVEDVKPGKDTGIALNNCCLLYIVDTRNSIGFKSICTEDYLSKV